MIPGDWIPHRRASDRELLGWIRPEGDVYVPVSRLGHDAGEPCDWFEAEAVLDRLGLGWLAGRWHLHRHGEAPIRVRIVDITPDRIRVKTEDHGAIDVPVDEYVLPFPVPEGILLVAV